MLRFGAGPERDRFMPRAPCPRRVERKTRTCLRDLDAESDAVWLVDNTSLSFDQIADFCNLHPLEVKGIADGEVAPDQGVRSVSNGQLARERSSGPRRLRPSAEDGGVEGQAAARQADEEGPALHAVSRRQDRPNAILWLLRNHPELKDAQIMRLVARRKRPFSRSAIAPIGIRPASSDGPGDAGARLADRP
jgi:hypothetical protein